MPLDTQDTRGMTRRMRQDIACTWIYLWGRHGRAPSRSHARGQLPAGRRQALPPGRALQGRSRRGTRAGRQSRGPKGRGADPRGRASCRRPAGPGRALRMRDNLLSALDAMEQKHQTKFRQETAQKSRARHMSSLSILTLLSIYLQCYICDSSTLTAHQAHNRKSAPEAPQRC